MSFNYNYRPVNRLSCEEVNQIVKMFLGGKPAYYIADYIGRTRWTVQRILKGQYYTHCIDPELVGFSDLTSLMEVLRDKLEENRWKLANSKKKK